MIKSRELALEIAGILDQKGATDITILQVDHLTSITDYFVIATGSARWPRTSRKSSRRRAHPCAATRA